MTLESFSLSWEMNSENLRASQYSAHLTVNTCLAAAGLWV